MSGQVFKDSGEDDDKWGGSNCCGTCPGMFSKTQGRMTTNGAGVAVVSKKAIYIQSSCNKVLPDLAERVTTVEDGSAFYLHFFFFCE